MTSRSMRSLNWGAPPGTIQYRLIDQPVGEQYRELLEWARPLCAYYALAQPTSPGLTAGPQVSAVIDRLGQPVQHYRARQRYGTIAEVAAVSEWRFNAAAIAALLEHSHALYDWQYPRLPEDLCLLRDHDRPLLISVAHEELAWVYLTPAERGTCPVQLRPV